MPIVTSTAIISLHPPECSLAGLIKQGWTLMDEQEQEHTHEGTPRAEEMGNMESD